jgi:hypothetical protein
MYYKGVKHEVFEDVKRGEIFNVIGQWLAERLPLDAKKRA